jgi:hypothetical protein
MSFLRRHWFDLGLIFIIPIVIYLFLTWNQNNIIQNLLWISLISLFIHQFEEYRFPGNFPKMMNTVMFKSDTPGKYPLNPNTSLIINVFTGWLTYLLATIFWKQAIWLSIASILVSAGNFIAHTMLFNIKGKTKYNPGMITSILLFLPISVIFFIILIKTNSATLIDWSIGLVLGIILNVFGILKMIDWLKDKNTKYSF